MSRPHPIPAGTQVVFDIEGLVVGTAVVAEADRGNSWAYRLDAVEITRGHTSLLQDLAGEADGHIWVCEHEMTLLTNPPPGDNT